MARLGYIRCRRKQDMDDFREVSQVDGVFIDLINELGESEGHALQEMLDQIAHSDTLVVRSLKEVADNVSQLRLFLSTIREKQVELVLLDSSNREFLTDEGFKTLSVINDFVEEKMHFETFRQKKLGRPVQPFPPDFLKVYTEYRDGAYNSNDAAKKLVINANRFRELVRIFET